MKASIEWLKEFSNINIDAKELGDILTMTGSKVETIEQKFGHISYDDLTYGDLITCVNLTGIRLCRDMKLQQKLKMENRQSRKELGN